MSREKDKEDDSNVNYVVRLNNNRCVTVVKEISDDDENVNNFNAVNSHKKYNNNNNNNSKKNEIQVDNDDDDDDVKLLQMVRQDFEEADDHIDEVNLSTSDKEGDIPTENIVW